METHHFSNLLLKKLHQKELLSQEQLDEVANYEQKNIFSLRSELLLLGLFCNNFFYFRNWNYGVQ